MPVTDKRIGGTISTTTPTTPKTHRTQWTCARCEMTSTWINGLDDDAAGTPPNWFTDENGDNYCLVCRRERAIDIALADAGEVNTEARAKLRTAAVVEFEIERDPERPEGEIARAARTSVAAVRKARKRLEGSVEG